MAVLFSRLERGWWRQSAQVTHFLTADHHRYMQNVGTSIPTGTASRGTAESVLGSAVSRASAKQCSSGQRGTAALPQRINKQRFLCLRHQKASWRWIQHKHTLAAMLKAGNSCQGYLRLLLCHLRPHAKHAFPFGNPPITWLLDLTIACLSTRLANHAVSATLQQWPE